MTNEERARAEELYQQHLELIGRCARRFARRYRLRFEDAIQDAGYFFLEAVRRHDPAKGSLESRIQSVIQNRLLDRFRSATGSKPGRKRVARATPVSQFARGDRESRIVSNARAGSEPAWAFGDDARVIISLLTGADMRGVLRVQRRAWEALRDTAGWDRERFCRAWGEILENLPAKARVPLACRI